MSIEKLPVCSANKSYDQLVERADQLPNSGRQFVEQMIAQGYIELRPCGGYGPTEIGLAAMNSVSYARLAVAA